MIPADIIKHLGRRYPDSVAHILKTHPEPFQSVWDGLKTYEVRRCDDRDFAVGQAILLLEWHPNAPPGCVGYTGRSIACEISYLTPGGVWGLPRDLCVFGLCNLQRRDEGPA